MNKIQSTSNPIMKQRGFTIIEVALVLAIAGLIFLVVFLALPALQNSQKDTARRQDVGKVVAALQTYEADNGGDLSSLVPQPAPSSGNFWGYQLAYDNEPLSGYINGLSQFNSILIYTKQFIVGDDGAWLKVAKSNIGVALAQSCASGSSGYNSSISTADAAVYAPLSNGTLYCVNM